MELSFRGPSKIEIYCSGKINLLGKIPKPMAVSTYKFITKIIQLNWFYLIRPLPIPDFIAPTPQEIEEVFAILVNNSIMFHVKEV